MKFVSEKDFWKIHNDLLWVYANFKTGIDELKLIIKYEVQDEKLKDELQRQVNWLKESSGGLEDLEKINEELYNRGVLNKGLRY